ncbi:MAG: Uma2 family endonuclease [Candidatus Rokuibacteriota bacterium]|nr:MAG: Uma2 family endonuclease [Candidatus Rokubacteria bacterium]
MATRPLLTYADYAAIPNDGRRYELFEGEVSVTPAPNTKHQRIIGNLYLVLREHVRRGGLGEVFVSPIDCILSDTSVVQPDLVFVETARSTAVSQRGIEGAPTLAVEVLSPSTLAVDRNVKGQLYARHGIPHYWIVDPEARTVEAFELAGGGYRLAATYGGAGAGSLPPFPDLRLDPAALWP